jgi:hypothetical protein
MIISQLVNNPNYMNKKLIWGIVVVVVVILGITAIQKGYVKTFLTWNEHHNDADYGRTGPVVRPDQTNNNSAPKLPTAATDLNPDSLAPVLTSITPNTTDKVNTQFVIKGQNLNGFEGSTLVIVTNQNGVKGYLYASSNIPEGSTTIKFTLPTQLCTKVMGESGIPCPSFTPMTPGVYKISVSPWEKTSNELTLIIMK